MKLLLNISVDFSFYLLLLFLFLINFSISACYFIFVFLFVEYVIRIIKRKKLPQIPRFFSYFLLYIFFTLVSTAFSIDKLNSLKDNKELFIFLLIPIFTSIINSKKRLTLSLYTILASALISSLLGIFITAKEGLSLSHRIKGLTSHWMTYSGLLMMVFIFFFIYQFYEKKIKIKLLILLTLGIIMLGILFSQTRSVWVGIIITVGLFIVYYKPKTFYIIVPSLIIIFIILPSAVKDRFVSIFDLENETNKDRIYMLYTGTKIFQEYPLTGVGPNNIKKIYHKYRHPKALQTNMHLHNNFLQILAERGIFGLLSLAIAFISIFILLLKKIKSTTTENKTIYIAVFFVFISFLISGIFEYNFGDSEMKFILFYFLSISGCQYNGRDNHAIKKS